MTSIEVVYVLLTGDFCKTNNEKTPLVETRGVGTSVGCLRLGEQTHRLLRLTKDSPEGLIQTISFLNFLFEGRDNELCSLWENRLNREEADETLVHARGTSNRGLLVQGVDNSTAMSAGKGLHKVNPSFRWA
jgi:hypothetical protein